MAKAKKPNRKKRYREYDAETLMRSGVRLFLV